MLFPSPDSDELDRLIAEAIGYPDEIYSTGEITNSEFRGVLSGGQKPKWVRPGNATICTVQVQRNFTRLWKSEAQFGVIAPCWVTRNLQGET